MLDLAANTPTAEAAAGVVIDAARSLRVTSGQLREALISAPCQRWRQACLDAVADASIGTHSTLERLYLHGVERAHDLPAGEWQTKSGSTWRDIYYRRFRTTVELDGRRGHDQAVERWRDQRRDNAAVERGDTPLRYGWFDVRHRPCAVAAQVARVLAANGWEGSLTPCGPGCRASTLGRGT